MEKSPDDVICLIEIAANQTQEFSWPAVSLKKTKARFGFLHRTPKETGKWTENTHRTFTEHGPLDYPDVPRTAARIADLARQAQDHLESIRPVPSQGLKVGESVVMQVWVGRRDSFAWRKHDFTRLRACDGERAPVRLKGPVSAAMLEETLSAFDTAAGRARAAERHRQMIETVAQDATVLRSGVKIRKPLGFRK